MNNGSTVAQSNNANMALLTGMLDAQRQGGRTVTHRVTRNGAQGLSIKIVLQLPGVFEGSYGLPIELVPGSPGGDHMTQLVVGDRISVSASLAWQEWPDPRFSAGAGYQRRIKQLVVRPSELCPAAPDAPLGSYVQLDGTVLGSVRVVRHPIQPNLTLAITTLAVETPRRQLGEHACITSIEHIPVAIATQHPDAPNLLRTGNRVRVEGSIDRYTVQLRGQDVDQALAALDADWQQRQAGMSDPTILMKEEQHYLRQRHQLSIGRYSRIVAGTAALVHGEPLPVRAAQRQRATQLAHIHRRRGGRMADLTEA